MIVLKNSSRPQWIPKKTLQMKHVRLNIYTNYFHASNTTVKIEVSKSRTRIQGHEAQHRYLAIFSSFNPNINELKISRTVSIPESQFHNTFIRKRGFPAHYPNQPQPRIRRYYGNDMTSKRRSLHAFYRLALFLLA